MWWQQAGLLDSFLDDFISDALHRRGLGDLLLDADTRATELLTNPRHFGFSSLDMVELARRFAQTLGLDRTGISDLLLARRSAEGWLGVARRSLEIDDSQFVFHTSGTTASPKPVTHYTWRLQREVNMLATLLNKPARIVSMVPTHHIYGFIWAIILPAHYRILMLRMRPEQSLPEDWAAQLRDGDMIIATPDIWSLVDRLDVKLPRYFTGISSTAPLAAEVAASLRQDHPDAVLMEVFGSTETAAIGWRIKDGSAFNLLPYWQLTTAGDDVRLIDRDSGDAHGLHDNFCIVNADQFKPLGRLDQVVQIAGHNVNLPAVARILCTYPGITDALVRPVDTAAGLRLKLYCVLAQAPESANTWYEHFSQWLGTQLGHLPPPSSIVIGDTRPVNTMNKAIDWPESTGKPVSGCLRSDFSLSQ